MTRKRICERNATHAANTKEIIKSYKISIGKLPRERLSGWSREIILILIFILEKCGVRVVLN
jgi:hypothetical protein